MTITFGIHAQKQELDSVAEILGRVLDVKFIPSESSFRGGDYCSAEVPEGEIILQGNRDLLPDDDPFEPEWPIDQLILFLEEEDEGEPWQKVIHSLETSLEIGIVRLK